MTRTGQHCWRGRQGSALPSPSWDHEQGQVRIPGASAQAEDSLPEACRLPHHRTRHRLTASSRGNGHGVGAVGGQGRSWEKGQLPEEEEGLQAHVHTDVSALGPLTQQSPVICKHLPTRAVPRKSSPGAGGARRGAAEFSWGKRGAPEGQGGGPPWEGRRDKCLSARAPGSLGGAGAQGVVLSPAWQAHLQEEWPVASHPARRLLLCCSPSLIALYEWPFQHKRKATSTCL